MQTTELPASGWNWEHWGGLVRSFWCHRSQSCSRLLQELCDGGAAGASTRFNSSLLPLSLSLYLSPSSQPFCPPLLSIQSAHKQLDKMLRRCSTVSICSTCVSVSVLIFPSCLITAPASRRSSVRLRRRVKITHQDILAGLCTFRSWSKWILLPSPGGREAPLGAGALLTISWVVSQFTKVPRRLLLPTGELGSVFSSAPCISLSPGHIVLPL